MPGLNSILGLISTLNTVERGLIGGEYIENAVRAKESDIVAKNVEQLYERGENSLGVSISSYAPYAPYTIQLKGYKGQPTDRVTLRDTGAFHKSFVLVIGPTSFYITAKDEKTDDLVAKYGAGIFGLTPENREEVSRKLLYPVVMEQIQKEIFK